MAIVHMKKVEFHTDEAYRNEIVEILNSQKEFHQSSNPLVGFVRSNMVEEVCSCVDVELATYTVSDPSIEDGDEPPVLLKGNLFTEPFIEQVKKHHASPLYYDIDPTPLFALGFCILFGIMFGDIGQGIILVLIGLLYKKNNSAKIFARVGIFSIIFGWLYGSVFGNEEFIPEFMHEHKFKYWHFELLAKENTERLLLLTITFGAILILLSMLLHIIDSAREKRLTRIFADRNGVAGFLFYGSLFTLAFTNAIGVANKIVWIIGLICLGASILIFILFRKGNIQSRLWYLWETVLESASSTMAFLMVGCFALAHATLMLVVFKVAEMTPVPLIVIILGNILVMGIEATEVYHQCMHLCFKTLLPFIVTEKED